MFPVLEQANSEFHVAHGLLSWKFPKSVGLYTLIGRSRAADATSFFIPELDLVLDCGCLTTASRPANIFITHAHGDHCLSINQMVSSRVLPKIYLPHGSADAMEEFIQSCRNLRAAGRSMNDWLPDHELIGVKPDDFLPFRKTMTVRSFNMDHSIPCLGYGFYDRRKKLKIEYQTLTAKEISDLKRSNKDLEVSEECLIPQFVFLGDTTTSVFETYKDELFKFPVIIVECSFIDHEKHGDRADDVKHIVWVWP